jgi:hypothetical protein
MRGIASLALFLTLAGLGAGCSKQGHPRAADDGPPPAASRPKDADRSPTARPPHPGAQRSPRGTIG